MDFHHVLPSNTSPNYFPNNNASQYSTPVDNPYVLTDDWEVGLVDVSYSTCVNSFNNDKITINENVTLGEVVREKDCPPVKVFLPVFPRSYTSDIARNSYAAFINKMFETLLSLKLNAKFGIWNLLTDDFYFIFSPPLKLLFQLWSDVLTKEDASFQNFNPFRLSPIPDNQDDTYIIVVPVQPSSSVKRVDIVLKKANEKITTKQLFTRFKAKVPALIATLIEVKQKPVKFALSKTSDDANLIFLNKRLRRALTFIHCAMYCKGKQQYVDAWFEEWDKPWSVSILTLNKIATYKRERVREVILPPCSFQKEQDAMTFVNEKVNDERIVFTCNTNNHVNLYIKDANMTVTFDDTLRDIFAFDQNTYSGKHAYTATGVFSLCRRIQYLYIYSNLTEFIRVGNTESPLLAIFPFSHTNNCNLLKEKVFKTPMYIKVSRERVSQIDIAIYDGAGQLVPFVADSVTTIHLHFRQI